MNQVTIDKHDELQKTNLRINNKKETIIYRITHRNV